ncbi:TIGR04219 family outer membrane beta-barrel protein [Neiella marina]|uniref:TIGR04219 family outer membrane beta-barrel protein n=1 Tax=Neiella holothuriorum TaxID=2870530 RepID=A0ABS7EFB9_9GAMM|nr:TIGR04219 family outer membrane beta-barrel protein [Neiella holothuriorum]MBW8191034.1 TIGR04219 family outer membrane beta-barrel protein [Neiella holothuriorum]
MKTKLIALAALATLPFASQADTFAGVYMGAQYWDMNADGGFGTGDLTQDYDLYDEGKGVIWVAVEHPVPLLPNFMLRYNQMDTDGSADVVDFEFGGIVYDGKSTVDAELDHIDMVMYYEILDNSLTSLDIGVNLKYGDYKVSVTGETTIGDTVVEESSQENYKGVIPMVYAASQLGIPGTGLSFFGEVNWIGVGDANAYDVQIGAQYLLIDNLAVDAGVQVGYRKVKFDIDDVSDLTIDAQFDGAFAGVMVHF